MKIPDEASKGEHFARLGKNKWRCSRLFHLSAEFPVMDIPLNHLHVYSTYEHLTLREMVMHMRAVQDADMSFPIILDEDGEIMDGRHRIMKAILSGDETIKAVRFDENPEPDERVE